MRKVTLPKTLGGTSDALYKLKLEKAALNKQLDALDEKRKALEEHAYKQLNQAKLLGGKGRVGQITKTEKDIPVIQDWAAFTRYVARTKQFDLIQRRLGEGAIKARWEDKKTVPGVGVFTRIGLSVTKVASKK
jgi:hypothetical protein